MEAAPKEADRPPSWNRIGRFRYFPDVTDQDWNDWRWQFRNRITTIDELARYLPIPEVEHETYRKILSDFRMAVTPYYLSLIHPDDPSDPIRRQVIPHPDEYAFRSVGDEDPLGEENFSPVPGITHRYPDRVLMVISNLCGVYCRHCTRKRIMYEDAVSDFEIDVMVDYIARTPTVRDVVVSGGDPLACATPKLESILSKLRAIPHLEIIRIGTRLPVVLPQRVDAELTAMLEKYHPLWINTHFNHPNECTPDSARAVDRLLRAGCPVNNQSVLLRGVNDSVPTMTALVHGLLKMRVRPYYLYQCDPVRGTEHLRTPVSKGIEIIEGLRGHTSGLAIPHLVIDAPGGGGKIPIGPQYMMSYDQASGHAVLRNFQDRLYQYHDPIRAPTDSVPVGDQPLWPLPSRSPVELLLGPSPSEPAAPASVEAPAAPVLPPLAQGATDPQAPATVSASPSPTPGNGNGNGNGKARRNGNGNGNGNGKGARAADMVTWPVVGKSRWVHRRSRNPANGGGGTGSTGNGQLPGV